MCVIRSYELFFAQAAEALRGIEGLWDNESAPSLEAAQLSPAGCSPLAESGERPVYLCHGDLDQHHVLMGGRYTAIIDFNPNTQVVEYLDEVYAREIVRMDMENLLTHGESVDASAYR